ncbi:hypothetical protein [Bradyrhizobium sp. 930_D9_N1_4]|uniref:hypothetical protein n=1 Tax=Bradyrhizobium sp. 930_D9_N1_4 TaxID=3240374 RepID=UPI003F89C290
MWKAIGEALQKLIESPQSLLIVAGIVLVALGAAGGITYNNWFPIQQQWAQIFVSIVGLLLALIGAFLVLVPPRSATPYGISITFPTTNALVGKTNVSGTIRKHPPKGYALWILRIYPTGEYVPLRKVDLPKGKTTWDALDCDVGGPPGEPRRLGAYLLGPSSQVMFGYWRDAVDRHNRLVDELNVPRERKDRWLPAFKEFPEDMIRCDTVNVIAS